MNDKLPPNSPEAERGILSCAIQSPDVFDALKGKLTARHFYDLRHQIVWEHLVKLTMPNFLALVGSLRQSGELVQLGGETFLNELQDAEPSPASYPSHLAELEEYRRLRTLLSATASASRAIQSGGTVQDVVAGLETALSQTTEGAERALTPANAADALINDLEMRFNLSNEGKRSGLVTGWHKFDDMTDGLQFGEQAVIGARPSMGKTAIATNLVERICLMDEIPTAFVTLEMSPAALCRRMVSSWCRIHMQTLRSGKMTEADFARVSAFQIMLRKRPLYFVDGVSGMTEVQVCSELRRLHRKHGIRFAVVDYLQKIRGSRHEEKKTYEVGAVSSALKAVAKELNIALVTLAQLNRENEKDKGRPPRTSDLGDSKQIEQDADLVALLHRPRTDDAEIHTRLMITKQRDGECDTVNLAFIGRFCRFENMTHQPPPNECDED